MIITEESIRERLALDKVKPSRVATWEEIEFLLDKLTTARAEAFSAIEDEILGSGALPPKWAKWFADALERARES